MGRDTSNALEPRIVEASRSDLASFRDFAAGLRRDQASIKAAIRGSRSNGPTEGYVNKLKLLKRRRYGRASVPLLRQFLLATA